jgi:DNA mismatch repair protein MutS
MRVKEWQGKVIFLHEVAPGTADRSYGIHVAQLAGLPGAVIARAQEVLHSLERGEQAGALARLVDDLPLFAAAPAAPAQPWVAEADEASEIEARLAAVQPDELSPREALEILYELRSLLHNKVG